MRKALHMTPGLFPFVLAAVPHPDPLQWNEVWFIAQICIVFTVGFLALHKVVRRPDEKNLLSTTLSYPIVILAMLALFRAHAEFTCVVVAILAFGDGAAYFGGTLFGKRKLPWNPQKSWAGLISFIAVSAPIASLAYWVEARNPSAPFCWRSFVPRPLRSSAHSPKRCERKLPTTCEWVLRRRLAWWRLTIRVPDCSPRRTTTRLNAASPVELLHANAGLADVCNNQEALRFPLAWKTLS